MEKEKKVIGYKDVFSQKEYLKLILASLISRFGDSVDSLAFTWLVYQVTGSAAWSAIVFAVNQLPEIIVQPFAGALVEGMNKKRLMVAEYLIRGIIVAALAILTLADMVTPVVLVVFTFLITTVEAFGMPAGMAIVPILLPEEYYEYGTSLKSTLSSVVELIGIALGGIIIGIWGIYVAILIDAVTFFGAAMILCFMKMKEEPLQKGKVDVTAYALNLKNGIAYVKNQPVIRNFCLMALLINAVVVPFNSLQGPIVSELLGQDAELLSVLGIVMVLAMGLGSAVFPYLRKKVSVRAVMVTSGMSMGAGLYVLTLGSFCRDKVYLIYAVTTISSLLLGMGAGILSAALNVQFMKVVNKEYLARAGAIFNAVSSAAVPVTSFLISAVAVHFSVGEILVVCAIFCVIIFAYIGIRKVRFE
ncbi:MAG: MFS transporter [Lachnospiraceae bacterium]|nr:MFS transporter [Lachnospiraceae bacterium]